MRAEIAYYFYFSLEDILNFMLSRKFLKYLSSFQARTKTILEMSEVPVKQVASASSSAAACGGVAGGEARGGQWAGGQWAQGLGLAAGCDSSGVGWGCWDG